MAGRARQAAASKASGRPGHPTARWMAISSAPSVSDSGTNGQRNHKAGQLKEAASAASQGTTCTTTIAGG
eukprot:4162696-Alexandrium_andersonii.AAC.1